MLRMCERAERFSNFKFEISDLVGRAVNVSKQLNGWIESLKNSEIKGAKFLTGKEREKAAREKEFEDFDREMEEFRRQHLEMLRKREEESAVSRRGNAESAESW
jgi:16S rRNA G527 N7-methylase RsmG